MLMKVVKHSISALALVIAVSVAASAQTPKPPAPKPQTPAPAPATTQPPATAPKLAPQPPAPFPQDAKFAFVDIQLIAQNSSAGKDASAKLKALSDKKSGEIGEKSKQLQALQTKQQSAGVLNDTARAQLDKEIERLQREIQFAQQSAQAEMQDLQNELQGEFQKKLLPIIADIAKEKGLHAVFSAQDAGAAYIHPGLDISEEVIKRLDAKKN
jgi:outer membrane protein